jgi:hypothetical protein
LAISSMASQIARRRRTSRAESGLAVSGGPVLPPSKTPPAPARPIAPLDSPARGATSPIASRNPPPGLPLAVSRALEAALSMAERCHMAFWFDEHGLLITQPPRDYRCEVQAAERSLMERREEIKTICCWPRRPKGYSDAHWVRAAVDSCRLGYNRWREGMSAHGRARPSSPRFCDRKADNRARALGKSER